MGDKFYYSDGSVLDSRDYYRILHRLDGPAIEFANGTKVWYVDGKRHRLDGPAIEFADGDKVWCVDDKRLTYEEFENYRAELFEEEVLSE